MKRNKQKIEKVTKTPEMIPSMFNWQTHDEQEKTANKLANVTKESKEK